MTWRLDVGYFLINKLFNKLKLLIHALFYFRCEVCVLLFSLHSECVDMFAGDVNIFSLIMRSVFQCVWEMNGVARISVGCHGRACTAASSRAASFAHRQHFISLTFYFSDKKSLYYCVIFGYSALLGNREDICAAGLECFHGKWRDGLTRVCCWWWWFSADRGPQWTRSHFHSITRKKH